MIRSFFTSMIRGEVCPGWSGFSLILGAYREFLSICSEVVRKNTDTPTTPHDEPLKLNFGEI